MMVGTGQLNSALDSFCTHSFPCHCLHMTTTTIVLWWEELGSVTWLLDSALFPHFDTFLPSQCLHTTITAMTTNNNDSNNNDNNNDKDNNENNNNNNNNNNSDSHMVGLGTAQLLSRKHQQQNYILCRIFLGYNMLVK